MIVVGIDSGSLSTDAVVLDENRKVLGKSVVRTGASNVKASESALEEALNAAGIKKADVGYVLSTGYGRNGLDFSDAQVTEITCHARGAHFLFPGTRTVIDIGGQDSKAIKVSEKGKVLDFAMNDKCAAGTGRFLEVMARTLEVELDDMGEQSLKSTNEVTVSSMCTVFAESEVVSLVAAGHPKEDIIRGLHKAISERTIALASRVGNEPEITFTGGVAKNKGMVAELEKKLNVKLNIFEDPQIVGAIGAGLIALERAQKAAAAS